MSHESTRYKWAGGDMTQSAPISDPLAVERRARVARLEGADAFERLRHLSDQNVRMRLMRLVSGDWHASRRVRPHEPVQIRIAMPAHLAGAQVMAFGRDGSGDVGLLSLRAHTNGDLRFREEACFPRADIATRACGSGGQLSLTSLGRHDFLAIIVGSPSIRLHSLAFFDGPMIHRAAPAEPVPVIGDGDLQRLLDGLLRCPSAEWAVGAASVEAAAEEDAGRSPTRITASTA